MYRVPIADKEAVIALRASHSVCTVWDAITEVFVYVVHRWKIRANDLHDAKGVISMLAQRRLN